MIKLKNIDLNKKKVYLSGYFLERERKREKIYILLKVGNLLMNLNGFPNRAINCQGETLTSQFVHMFLHFHSHRINKHHSDISPPGPPGESMIGTKVWELSQVVKQNPPYSQTENNHEPVQQSNTSPTYANGGIWNWISYIKLCLTVETSPQWNLKGLTTPNLKYKALTRSRHDALFITSPPLRITPPSALH